MFNGPIDNLTFHAYVTEVLVPTLRPGDVIVLDNLKVHHHPAVRLALEAAGAVVRFLPRTGGAPSHLRSGLRPDRHRPHLFTADECANYIRHCGYRVATSL